VCRVHLVLPVLLLSLLFVRISAGVRVVDLLDTCCSGTGSVIPEVLALRAEWWRSGCSMEGGPNGVCGVHRLSLCIFLCFGGGFWLGHCGWISGCGFGVARLRNIDGVWLILEVLEGGENAGSCGKGLGRMRGDLQVTLVMTGSLFGI